MKKIAVLLTCHNRKEHTLNCLYALREAIKNTNIEYKIFVVDDGSTDGTSEDLLKAFPNIKLILGDGGLYWAGGMRMAWEEAIQSKTEIDYFLLLNDDTQLYDTSIANLLDDVKGINTDLFILVGSTQHPKTGELTYGGRKLISHNKPASIWLYPNNESPQLCDLGNANFMLVSKSVVDGIGILSEHYTHGIADYDYTLTAIANKVPVYITSNYIGKCDDDHGNSWLSNATLRKRMDYLYSVKGLNYVEYTYFIKKFFPKYIVKAKSKLWLKTLFPIIWNKLK